MVQRRSIIARQDVTVKIWEMSFHALRYLAEFIPMLFNPLCYLFGNILSFPNEITLVLGQ